MEESIFEAFGTGSLELPELKKDFSRIPWEAHPLSKKKALCISKAESSASSAQQRNCTKSEIAV